MWLRYQDGSPQKAGECLGRGGVRGEENEELVGRKKFRWWTRVGVRSAEGLAQLAPKMGDGGR